MVWHGSSLQRQTSSQRLYDRRSEDVTLDEVANYYLRGSYGEISHRADV